MIHSAIQRVDDYKAKRCAEGGLKIILNEEWVNYLIKNHDWSIIVVFMSVFWDLVFELDPEAVCRLY